MVAEVPDPTSAAGQVLSLDEAVLASHISGGEEREAAAPAAANAAVPISKFMKVGIINSWGSRPDCVVIRLP